MKMEELLKVIENSNVEYKKGNFGELNEKLDLVRDLNFSVNNVNYRINWYHNLMTLFISDNVEVKFTRIEHSGTYPNGYMRNLQFYYCEHCVCLIGLEKYPFDKQDNHS